jgi:uncharacterized protein Veg
MPEFKSLYLKKREMKEREREPTKERKGKRKQDKKEGRKEETYQPIYLMNLEAKSLTQY